MSRLEKHLEKERKQRLFLIIFLIIFLVVFFFLYGIQIIIDTSIFISKLTSKKNPIETNQQSTQYGLLDIENIPMATNSSTIEISGSVFNLKRIVGYLNKEKVIEKDVKNKNSFNLKIESLKEGNNDFYLEGFDEKNNLIKKTQNYNIFYKKKKPKIEIEEPQDNFQTNKDHIVIKGKTEPETMIKINDLPVVVDALGKFETEINLSEGENKIKIFASDIAGNTEEKIITVSYQKED